MASALVAPLFYQVHDRSTQMSLKTLSVCSLRSAEGEAVLPPAHCEETPGAEAEARDLLGVTNVLPGANQCGLQHSHLSEWRRSKLELLSSIRTS